MSCCVIKKVENYVEIFMFPIPAVVLGPKLRCLAKGFGLEITTGTYKSSFGLGTNAPLFFSNNSLYVSKFWSTF